MKRRILIAFSSFIIAVANSATGSLLHTEAHASMSKGFSNKFMPDGTEVNVSITYDISSGGVFTSTINSVRGTFSWNDGVSLRVFDITDRAGRGVAMNGTYSLDFVGTSPIIEGSYMSQFTIDYNLGVNPFNTTNELSDLLLNSSIIGFFVEVIDGSVPVYGRFYTDVSGSTTVIPEPCTLSLLALGAFLAGRKRT